MTIRLQEPELLPCADHRAWQASWNDDEHLLAHCPPAYWEMLVIISQVKRVLQDDMAADLRLRFLEILHKLVCDHLTLEAMQRVGPACDTAMEMLHQMKGLTNGDQSRLFMKWNVIAAFANLNYSILEAIRLFSSSTTQPRVRALEPSA